MLIKDLKENHPIIYNRALECQVEQGSDVNENLPLNTGSNFGGFNWAITKEGFDIWEAVNDGDYDAFYNNFNVFDRIREWANERGLIKGGDVKTQTIKLVEEVGELSRAVIKSNEEEFIDAIGDCVVVLTNLAAIKGLKIEDCIDKAYDVIKNRKGKMENGSFIKNEEKLDFTNDFEPDVNG